MSSYKNRVNDFSSACLPAVTSSTVSNTAKTHTFPFLTNYVKIRNTSTFGKLLVGVTSDGLNNTNNFQTIEPGCGVVEPWMLTQVILKAETAVSVSYELVAGLSMDGATHSLTGSGNTQIDFSGVVVIPGWV